MTFSYIFLLRIHFLLKSICRLQNCERDYNRAKQEIGQLRSVIERLRLDKAELEEQLNEVRYKRTTTYFNVFPITIKTNKRIKIAYCHIIRLMPHNRQTKLKFTNLKMLLKGSQNKLDWKYLTVLVL